MKNSIKKIKNNLAYIIIGSVLAISASVVYAANVSVPQATQKGDLPSGLTTGNYQLQHPGADGTCLTASSTSPTGLAYASCPSGSGSSTGTPNTIAYFNASTALTSTSTFTFLPTGNLIIGTTTVPSTSTDLLYVDSAAGPRITAATEGTTTRAIIRVVDNTTTNNAGNFIINPSGTSNASLALVPLSVFQASLTGTTGGYYLGTQANAPLVLFTGGVASTTNQRMVIGGNGQISTGTSTLWASFGIQGLATSTIPIFEVASSTGSIYLSVQPSGNVGIGTTTPGQALTVVGSIQQTTATNSLAAFDQNGVLIATTTPSGITGGINGFVTRYTSPTTQSTGILLDNGTVSGVNATSSTVSFNLQGTGSLDPFNVSTSTSSSLFVIKSNGNVGINSSTPAVSFVVASSTNTSIPTLYVNPSGGTSGVGQVTIGSTTPAAAAVFTVATNFAGLNQNDFINKSTSTSAGVILELLNDVNAQYQMTMFGSQNTLTYGSYGNTISLAGAARWRGSSASTKLVITNGGASPIIFGTSDTERMRIDSGGNVGIGTSTPIAALGIVSSGTSLDVQSSGGSFPPSRFIVDSTGVYTSFGGGTPAGFSIAQSGLASLFSGNAVLTLRTGSGSMVFQTNGSNTRMVIDTSGDVGINTTTPKSVLYVQASSSASTIPLFTVATTTGQSLYSVLGDGNIVYLTASATQATITGGTCLGVCTDSSGTVSVTSSTFTYIFNVPFTNKPKCFVSDEVGDQPFPSIESTTSTKVSGISPLGSDVVNINCHETATSTPAGFN